jgi:predicted nucleotidyltransferase
MEIFNMNTRDIFYTSDNVEAFQVLSFNDENTNPVEIEIHNPDEYEVNKERDTHRVRIKLDKEEFTQLAINWLKSSGLL